MVSLIDLSPETNCHLDTLSTNLESFGFARQPWYDLGDSLVGFGGRPT